MPELPEVETTVRALNRAIAGRRIRSAWVGWRRLFERSPERRALPAALVGRRIYRVDRTGKFVCFRFASGATLALHQKMSGRITIGAPDQYARFTLTLDDGRQVVFSDKRKFGRGYFYRRAIGEPLTGLGPDAAALAADPAAFGQRLAARRGRIKSVLLNQAVVAGIGNIYADEILWRAKIHPVRLASVLTTVDHRRLAAATRAVLGQAMRRGGTSFRDYLDPNLRRGTYWTVRAVYQRAGEPCRRCRTSIQKATVGGRGTHYCPTCQRV
ncbi:bifunctional DNA-formamidopyrimidine glycosylase/DNA-(apurinic or apyrimidinic site) lyase [Candidatus Parcubacteria bacterium]|nr:bifunctional DNA-formamidopyrimidine glycosylase/DNA-(apurinic or apyrimidinic site) lyase [Candidatus Parcubacteria bacterium]